MLTASTVIISCARPKIGFTSNLDEAIALSIPILIFVQQPKKKIDFQ